jgi:peptidylprolyl isomerase
MKPAIDRSAQKAATVNTAVATTADGAVAKEVAGSDAPDGTSDEAPLVHREMSQYKDTQSLNWREPMAKAREGHTVMIRYTGKLEDGAVFDSSACSGPLEFTIGEGALIVPLERAVVGMEVGEQKTVSISPEAGFGERNDELVMDFPRANLPPNSEVAVGDRLKMRTRDGQEIDVILKKLTEESMTVDANHLLAGKTVLFEVELVEIKVA